MSHLRLFMFCIIPALILCTLGCASAPTPPPEPPPPLVIDLADVSLAGHDDLDQAWLRVLTTYITSAGRFDYAACHEHLRAPGHLDRFLAHALRTWSRQPDDIFADQDARTAFLLNVYQAAVIRAVLACYPVSCLRECPVDFYSQIIYRRDNLSLNLNDIAAAVRKNPDPRIDFAIVAPSIAGPPFAPYLYQPDQLSEQLDQAFQTYLGSCAGLRFDHDNRTVLIGPLIYDRRNSILRRYQQLFHLPPRSLVTALAPWAAPLTQVQLAEAAGYSDAPLEPDLRLNDTDIDLLSTCDPDDIPTPCGIR